MFLKRDSVFPEKVLVACEESQAVTIAFRNLGIEAYSCDIIPCSGGHPEWHIQDDVLKHLDDGWDMMIAHPPCTFLANSGVQNLHKKTDRWGQLDEGQEFFYKILNADIPKIAIENPVPHRYAKLPAYTQIIHPWQHGDECQKRTCLWLKNLPPLLPTKIVGKGEQYFDKNGKPNGSMWYQRETLAKGKIEQRRDPRLFPVSQKLWRRSGGIRAGLTSKWDGSFPPVLMDYTTAKVAV